MQIYGKNVSKEKIMTGDRINKIYLSDNFRDRELISIIKKKNIKVTTVSNKILDKMTNSGLHQGIVLEVDEFKTYDLSILNDIKNKYPLVVMLDHLEDPHNFGAIIRTCEAYGADAIIIPNDRSVSITSTVVKTSVGAIENIKIIRVPNLSSTLLHLKKIGYWVVGTDMSGTNYTDIDYKTSICLVIGNEGKGMSKVIENNCDYIANIPMKGKVNSLNASVSCGIMISEITRQRNI